MAYLTQYGGRICGKMLFQRFAFIGNVARKSTAVNAEQIENVVQAKPYEDIPGPKGIYNLPLLGTMFHFKPFTKMGLENVSILLNEMFEKYGTVFKWRFGEAMVMICDPKDVETVFRNEGKYPVRPTTTIGSAYSRRNNFKASVVDVNGEAWHALRTPLNRRLMKVGSAHVYLQSQNEVADEFVQILASQKLSPNDLAEMFFCYAAESIGVVCFNARLGFLGADAMTDPETVAFLKASKDVFVHLHRSVYGLSLIGHDYFRNKVYRDYEQCRLTLRANTLRHLEKAKGVLESRKQDGTLDPDEPNLLLSLLSDEALEFGDIVVTIKSLYVAGTDSTAKNLQTFFYNLATNPDKQELLRAEIHRVIGRDQPVTAEALSKLDYLKACLKESFRLLYPTVSGTRRKIPTDVVLGGYKVPAGTIVSMHNPRSCQQYFSNPDKYIPERWMRSSDGLHQETVPMTASLPFGYGPRNCIGRRFAEQEMYLAVAKTLQNLKIEIEPESFNTNFIYSLFIQPVKRIKFKFTKLNN